MDADGSDQTNLTNNSGDRRQPGVVARRHQDRFHTARDGNYEIYVMDADGGDQTSLTDDVAARTADPSGRRTAARSPSLRPRRPARST